MRPGQIQLTAEPADEGVRRDLYCPSCGRAWHVDAAACGNCGWHLPFQEAGTLSAPCALCHQSNYVDSLTNRCTRCHPIKIDDIPPELQVYADRARSDKNREIGVGMSVGPGLIIMYVIYAFSSKDDASFILWFVLILTPLFLGLSLAAFLRKRKLLRRYYRLGFVMRYVKPIDAELKYDALNNRARYFRLCRLGPGSVWRGVRENKIRVDFPAIEDEQLVINKNALSKFLKGFDPMDPEHFWAKVYFDPDQSGSAVIRIANSIFVSAKENYEFY
jgi:ribosomal protein S27AE